MKFRFSGLLIVLVLLAAAVSGCGSTDQAIQTANQTGLTQMLLSSFGDVGKILGSITDSTSADNAVPQLQGVGNEVDDLVLEYGNASPDLKTEMGNAAAAQIPVLQKTIDSAYAIPGVESSIKSTMDSLMAKYMSF